MLWGHLEETLLLNKFFFPIVDTCLSCEDIAQQSVRWCTDGEFLVIFLRPVFSASGVQHVSDLHSKIALRPHHGGHNKREDYQKCSVLCCAPQLWVETYQCWICKLATTDDYILLYTLLSKFLNPCKWITMSSVLWHCWLGVRKSMRPVKKLNYNMLLWLSVWRKVQIICIRSSWCHCHPIISCSVKIQIDFTILVPAYPGCRGKYAVKQVSGESFESRSAFDKSCGPGRECLGTPLTHSGRWHGVLEQPCVYRSQCRCREVERLSLGEVAARIAWCCGLLSAYIPRYTLPPLGLYSTSVQKLLWSSGADGDG